MHGLHIAEESAVGSPQLPRRQQHHFHPVQEDPRSQPSTKPGLRRTSIPIVQSNPSKQMGMRMSATLQLQLDNRQPQPQLVKPTAIRLHRAPQPNSPLEIKTFMFNSPSTDSNHSTEPFPHNQNKSRKYSELVPLERNDKIEYIRPRAQSNITNERKSKIFPILSWTSKQKFANSSRFESSPIRRSINRQSIPSAVFYDDAEPPVHC